MNNTVQIIPFVRLGLAFIPVIAVVGILFKWSLDYRTGLYAVFRMLLQLLLVGYFLTYIFENDRAWIVITVLAGMIFANAMNSVSLAAERLAAELDRNVPYERARHIALRASLIPITNALFAVGLVSLPGMMTGQILSDVSPLIAARYQIMVMCMIFGAAGLSSAVFLLLVRSHLSDFIIGEKVESA